MDSSGQSLSTQLEDALAIVAREAPLHFARMRRQVGELTALIRVGEAPPMKLLFTEGPPWVRPGATGSVEVSLSRADLARLLRGELTIDEGIVAGTVQVRSQVDHLLRWFDGLASWLHGTLRSPSLPALHHQFFSTGQTTPVRPKGNRTC